jgi:hypothetical protein
MARASNIMSRRGFQGAMLIVTMALASCSTTGRETTGSIPRMNKPVEQMNTAELATASRKLGEDYARNPKDRNVGLSYATILRMTGKNGQALAVMRQVAITNPDHLPRPDPGPPGLAAEIRPGRHSRPDGPRRRGPPGLS